jgi:RNA polymerase sigma-32 factor
MSDFMNMQLALPTGSLESYIQSVNQVPLLSADEERALAIRLREHNDLDAARNLVLSHLRFVVRVARGYSGYGLALADLIQEGNIGLMKAVKRFDPDRGVRLVSFAVHWVRAEIHEFILRNWRIVKVATTKAQRKLFFNLRSAKKRLGWMNQEEVDAVAKDLGVTTKDVLDMEERLSMHDAAFDGAVNDSDEEEVFSPAAYLQDEIPGPEEIVSTGQQTDSNQQRLKNALESLDERSKNIIYNRWLADKKATLHELAKDYSVSAERIRQLEQAAMKKLQLAMSV